MMQTEHAIKIQTESFEGFESIFLNEEFALGWNCLFVLPVWLKSWWDVFGGNQDPEILTGYRHGKLIGVAPLHVEENTARFIGEKISAITRIWSWPQTIIRNFWRPFYPT